MHRVPLTKPTFTPSWDMTFQFVSRLGLLTGSEIFFGYTLKSCHMLGHSTTRYMTPQKSRDWPLESILLNFLSKISLKSFSEKGWSDLIFYTLHTKTLSSCQHIDIKVLVCWGVLVYENSTQKWPFRLKNDFFDPKTTIFSYFYKFYSKFIKKLNFKSLVVFAPFYEVLEPENQKLLN